jgi:hypothetical protein
MAVREFSDRNGVLWRVWRTRPSRDVYLGKFREGWLTFECAGERRRLAPVPASWEDLSVTRLELMCRAAETTETQLGIGDAAGRTESTNDGVSSSENA